MNHISRHHPYSIVPKSPQNGIHLRSLSSGKYCHIYLCTSSWLKVYILVENQEISKGDKKTRYGLGIVRP